MKIVLVHPPSEPLTHEAIFGLKTPPLGLAYIAAYLEERGFTPDIIDMSVQQMSIEEFGSRLQTTNPDVVGVYCSITRVKQSLQVAQVAKSLGATTILGGPHATLEYETLIRNENVDMIIRGEGEETFVKLAKLIDSQRGLHDLKGIVYKENGKVRTNPEAPLIADLDTLPFPAFHLLPMKSYHICNYISVCTLSSSRGCSRRCKYCIVPDMYQGKWRGKTPNRVVDEMEHLSSVYNPDLLLFFDEFFTEDLKRVESVMEEIRNRDLDVKWACMSTGTNISKELMINMQKAGCMALFFGVGSEVIASRLTTIDKKDLDEARRAFMNAHQANIFTIANVVFGFPGETRTDYEDILNWVIESDPDHALFFKAVPYSEFEDDKLDRMERFAYKRFYGRKSYVAKHIARSISRAVRSRQFSLDFIRKYTKWYAETLRKVNSFQDLPFT